MDSVTQGTLVADRYRLIRAIGFGGMGTVWLAHDQALDSPCALKLIGATQARQEEFRIRFECEAKCAAQLRGPHVVDVFNRGQWQGKPFIVMEYLEGEDLGVRLERLGRLEVTETYRVVAHIARALMRAHALGIVHRDIKPGNIFLAPGDEHETAKILDFGVAKHRSLPNEYEARTETAFIGTPCYMSPEQARGERVDWRSDLWALAVIVFECLTGDVPFEQEEVVDVVAAITRCPVPSLLEKRPDLPPAVESWWRRATAKQRDLRFQSAKEFADALADALGLSRLHIADFPHAAAEAPTMFVPLGISASRRGGGDQAHLAPRPSYESDAGVTIHSDAPSEAELAAFLPGYGRSRSPYFIGATAVCAALVWAVSAFRPALADAASGFGFSSVARGIGIESAAMVDPNLAAPRVPSPARPPILSAEPRAEGRAQAAEPLVDVLPEPTPPVLRASNTSPSPPVRTALALPKASNNWRPLAPPAPAPAPTAVVSRPLELPELTRVAPPPGSPARDVEPPAESLRTAPLEETKDYGI